MSNIILVRHVSITKITNCHFLILVIKLIFQELSMINSTVINNPPSPHFFRIITKCKSFEQWVKWDYFKSNWKEIWLHSWVVRVTKVANIMLWSITILGKVWIDDLNRWNLFSIGWFTILFCFLSSSSFFFWIGLLLKSYK